MNRNISLHIKVNENIKTQAEKILNKIGLTTTDAINVFLNKVVLSRSIPFELTVDDEDCYTCEYGYVHKPNKETLKAMKEGDKILKDLQDGKNVKTYKSAEELFKEIGV
ncbi:MAG: type II toxin-antitoxin system RelB/DinJ family antitoxin [Elusimicrobiota bacterium]|jgi:DNA-damage-inducible protein J|nr:type II toxin-antitoxin system RelB/DinJ family antitoxin [Elusimicrobiota bacterium]